MVLSKTFSILLISALPEGSKPRRQYKHCRISFQDGWESPKLFLPLGIWTSTGSELSHHGSSLSRRVLSSMTKAQGSSLSNSMCLLHCFNSMMLTSFNQASLAEQNQNLTSGREIIKVWPHLQLGVGSSGMTVCYCWFEASRIVKFRSSGMKMT